MAASSGPFRSQKTLMYLEGEQLIGAVIALNAANGVSFVDLLGITAILPTIAVDYHAEGTISWAATSQLIGATIGQCILGYMSDLYSRRQMLLFALTLLTLSSLACALSSYCRSASMLYVARGVAGIATGSVSNLVNIAQNDFLPVHRRGKYQGIQGISVAVGSIIGAIAGAGFAADVHYWQALYYMETGLAILGIALIFHFVPANVQAPKWADIRTTWETFDFWGILSGTGFVVPLLILMCQNSSLKSGSPITITLIVLTICCAGVFLFLGFRTRKVRPVIPFSLFGNRTIAAILVQNVLFGAVYYSFIYFIPLYLQLVRMMSPLKQACIFVPYFVAHGTWSTISGLIVSKLQNQGRRSYSLVLLFGFCIWTLAMGLLAWTVSKLGSNLGLLILFEIAVGLGTGSVFQNSIMAIRAQVTADQNAVAVSTRNVLRFFGGALGIAIASAVMEQRLKWSMPWRLEWVSDNAFSHVAAGTLSLGDQAIVQHAYSGAISWVFYISTGMIGLCVVLCTLIRDVRKEQRTSPSEGIRDVEKYASPSDAGERDVESNGNGDKSETRTFHLADGSDDDDDDDDKKSETHSQLGNVKESDALDAIVRPSNA